MPPAARLTDQHLCDKGPGPIVSSASTVNIGFLPAARVGDRVACPYNPTISSGSATVFIQNAMAARVGDATNPTGTLQTGCATVNIGSTPEIDALTTAAAKGIPFLDCETCRMNAAK